MKSCVLDASVVAAAFFQDEYAENASQLLASTVELHAPDLLYAEVTNVIWKRFGRGEIDEAEATELGRDLLSLPLQATASSELVESALAIALATGRTVYDCIYLAMAIERKSVLVTGDRRLANALSSSPLKKHVMWVGDAAL